MARILGLVGSPRKGSNTDILVQTILEEARINEYRASKLHLYDLDISPCIDCRGCKKNDLSCVVDDGMQAVYPLMDRADVIIFGTPVYWWGPSGPMKMLIDRLRPCYGSGLLEGKRAVMVAPAGGGPDEADLLVEMFRRTFEALRVEFVGVVLGKAYDRKEILADEAAMHAAREIGASL